MAVDLGTMIELWTSFEVQVINPRASAVQRQEMKMAFYAGAKGILDKLLTRLDPELEPTDNDLVAMDKIYDELLQFGVDNITGTHDQRGR